jgi:hypothetical protein
MHIDFPVLLGTMLMCYSMHLSFSRCSFEGILPLRIGAASTAIYIERGVDWCGQDKITLFEGSGMMSTCHHGICSSLCLSFARRSTTTSHVLDLDKSCGLFMCVRLVHF